MHIDAMDVSIELLRKKISNGETGNLDAIQLEWNFLVGAECLLLTVTGRGIRSSRFCEEFQLSVSQVDDPVNGDFRSAVKAGLCVSISIERRIGHFNEQPHFIRTGMAGQKTANSSTNNGKVGFRLAVLGRNR